MMPSTGSLSVRKREVEADAQIQAELRSHLGLGPMRFGPYHRDCSFEVEAKLRGWTAEEFGKFQKVKAKWERIVLKDPNKYTSFLESEKTIFRIYAHCDHDQRRTLRYMKQMDGRYFHITAMELGGQLRTRTLFPCPGLKTREGHNVMYMRPSRYDPKETPMKVIIDNLVFVMNEMSRKDPSSGIALLANMDGWTMLNFSVEYCRKFMSVLQGHDFPVKVDKFYILNPPSWFGKVWAIMKPMLSYTFRRGVRIIKTQDLSRCMDVDFQECLPDEIRGGEVDTGDLVRDFGLYHITLERLLLELSKRHQEQKTASTESRTALIYSEKNRNILILRGFTSRRAKIESALKPNRGILRRLSLGSA